jgi:GDP-mannose pyrophosphatase NudK
MDKVKILSTDTLSKMKYHLQKVTFELTLRSGKTQKQVREVYEKGSGATILLYNKEQRTIILTRQFRIPTFMNGVNDGMLIEAPAGMLDELNPEDCIRKEVEEETGFKIQNVNKIFEAFMCPGAVTEILHFFIGEYTNDQKVSEGGGLADEGEDIEVIETKFDEAYSMIEKGQIRDAKTIMLLQYAKCNMASQF